MVFHTLESCAQSARRSESNQKYNNSFFPELCILNLYIYIFLIHFREEKCATCVVSHHEFACHDIYLSISISIMLFLWKSVIINIYTKREFTETLPSIIGQPQPRRPIAIIHTCDVIWVYIAYPLTIDV